MLLLSAPVTKSAVALASQHGDFQTSILGSAADTPFLGTRTCRRSQRIPPSSIRGNLSAVAVAVAALARLSKDMAHVLSSRCTIYNMCRLET
jgi:hypothetical protein